MNEEDASSDFFWSLDDDAEWLTPHHHRTPRRHHLPPHPHHCHHHHHLPPRRPLLLHCYYPNKKPPCLKSMLHLHLHLLHHAVAVVFGERDFGKVGQQGCLLLPVHYEDPKSQSDSNCDDDDRHHCLHATLCDSEILVVVVVAVVDGV